MKVLASLLLPAALVACSTTLSPTEVATSSNERLCTNYERTKSPLVRAELTKRGAVNAREWGAIDQDSIYSGMSRTAVFCLLGDPNHTLHGKINTTVTGGQKVEQFVYRKSSGGTVYVYVRNGYASSWQY